MVVFLEIAKQLTKFPVNDFFGKAFPGLLPELHNKRKLDSTTKRVGGLLLNFVLNLIEIQ